jgi:hypothetical protein
MAFRIVKDAFVEQNLRLSATNHSRGGTRDIRRASFAGRSRLLSRGKEEPIRAAICAWRQRPPPLSDAFEFVAFVAATLRTRFHECDFP